MSEYICLKHSNFPFQVCKRLDILMDHDGTLRISRELLPIFLRKDFQYLPCLDDVINFVKKCLCVCLVWNVHIESKCLLMAKVSPDAPDAEQELLIFVSSQNGFGETNLGHQQVCSLNDWVIPSHNIIFKKVFFFNLLQFIRLWYTNFSTFSLCLSYGILEVLVYMIRVTRGLLLWMNFGVFKLVFCW